MWLVLDVFLEVMKCCCHKVAHWLDFSVKLSQNVFVEVNVCFVEHLLILSYNRLFSAV